ncbi:unnamed protein product [Coregonus sp. 'balchen']|nr:unnamed protein product [Coregonus sp. 'balchen']
MASSKASSNMEPFPQSIQIHMCLMDSQAVLEDFADVTQYERGHLNPDQHQSEPLEKAATYTLTNFNTGPWAQHLDRIRQRLNNYCCGNTYVDTGRYCLPVFGAYGLNDRVNNAVVEVPIKTLENFLKGRMDVDKYYLQ